MNESGYIRSIHKKLPASVYAWKISDRFCAGIPDTWYSGNADDLFVEYKYNKNIPKRSFTPGFTDLQKHWLNARYAEGRNVAGIVGFPKAGIILLNGAWNHPVKMSEATLLGKNDIVDWIIDRVTIKNG